MRMGKIFAQKYEVTVEDGLKIYKTQITEKLLFQL